METTSNELELELKEIELNKDSLGISKELLSSIENAVLQTNLSGFGQTPKIKNISIEDIIVSDKDIEKEIRNQTSEEFAELLISIAQSGVIEPVIVNQTPDDEYEVLSGRHRITALKFLFKNESKLNEARSKAKINGNELTETEINFQKIPALVYIELPAIEKALIIENTSVLGRQYTEKDKRIMRANKYYKLFKKTNRTDKKAIKALFDEFLKINKLNKASAKREYKGFGLIGRANDIVTLYINSKINLKTFEKLGRLKEDTVEYLQEFILGTTEENKLLVVTTNTPMEEVSCAFLKYYDSISKKPDIITYSPDAALFIQNIAPKIKSTMTVDEVKQIIRSTLGEKQKPSEVQQVGVYEKPNGEKEFACTISTTGFKASKISKNLSYEEKLKVVEEFKKYLEITDDKERGNNI